MICLRTAPSLSVGAYERSFMSRETIHAKNHNAPLCYSVIKSRAPKGASARRVVRMQVWSDRGKHDNMED